MEQETIEGFDIPLRELTEEEASRPITLERFQDFHYEVGEDFIDQIDSVNSSRIALQFYGYSIAKHPEWSSKLIESCDVPNPYTQLVQSVYDDFDTGNDGDLFYSDFAEFVNFTVDTKKRINQVLIQIEEYYSI